MATTITRTATTSARSAPKMMKRKLTQFLTTPSKVVSTLNWRELNGSILSLDLATDKKTIGLALASHPSQDEEVISNLKPISIKYEQCENDEKRVLSKETIDELQKTISRNNVCAMVVGWPLNTSNNRIGASCGKVLHTLDKLIESSTVLDKKPFCLHTIPSENNKDVDVCEEDVWGRSQLWARPCSDPNQTEYIASKEQYNYDSSASSSNGDNEVAVKVVNDFLQEQWPHYCFDNGTSKDQERPKQSSSSSYDHSWLENCESTGCSSGMKLSLL